MTVKSVETAKDNDTATITLKDVDANSWSLLYKFISPSIDPSLHAKIDHNTVSILLPLFHCYGILQHVGLCKKNITDIIDNTRSNNTLVTIKNKDINFWSDTICVKRPVTIANILLSFDLAASFVLKKFLKCGGDALSYLVSHLEYKGNLFNLTMVCS
jgi:hypothetical protein